MQERYGRNFVGANLTIQDWGVTYDELEPYFDKFEFLLGTGGKAEIAKAKFGPAETRSSPSARANTRTRRFKEQYRGVLFREEPRIPHKKLSPNQCEIKAKSRVTS